MTTPPHAFTAVTLARLPILVRWRHLILLPDDSVMVISYVWCTRGRWRRSAEARQRGWSVQAIGGFVVASRPDG